MEHNILNLELKPKINPGSLESFQNINGYEYYQTLRFEDVPAHIFHVYLNYLNRKVNIDVYEHGTINPYYFKNVLEIYPNNKEAKRVKKRFYGIINDLRKRRIIR